MSSIKGAARVTDLITHGKVKGAAAGKIAVAAVEAAKVAWTVYRVAKVGAAFVPGVGWGALALSFVVDFAVSTAIEKGVQYLVEKKHTGVPMIAEGSPNVYTNDLKAARGKNVDKCICCGNSKVQQGSAWVSINKKPASRLDDFTTCGNITSASPDVAIGGPPTEFNPNQTLDRALFVLTLYNAMKTGGITGVVQGTGFFKGAGMEMGKEILKEGGKQAAGSLQQSFQEGGYLPW